MWFHSIKSRAHPRRKSWNASPIRTTSSYLRMWNSTHFVSLDATINHPITRNRKLFGITTEMMFYVHSLLSTWVFDCSIWIPQENICERIWRCANTNEKMAFIKMSTIVPASLFYRTGKALRSCARGSEVLASICLMHLQTAWTAASQSERLLKIPLKM